MKVAVALSGIAMLVVMSGRLAPLVHAQDLPKGEEILDKYIEVTGGKEAYEKIKSRVMTGTIKVAGAGIEGTVSLYQALPNKVYVESNIPGVTKAEEGTDGQIVWEKSTVTGPRIKQGSEKAAYLRRHALDSDLNWRKYYTKAECKAVEKIDGKEYYKVVLTPKEGEPETQYFDKVTGLVAKALTKEKTPFGEVDAESTIVEYKKVDGITMPFKITQKILTNEISVTIDKVEHNSNIPADKFKVPEDIQKLAEKEKEKK